jgi:hypothetical protein
MRWAAAALGVVGGLVGAVSAFSVLGGGSPGEDGQSREWLGVFGFSAALVAGLAGLLARRWPRPAAPVMMAAGILGCAAMNLFNADTYYLAALPLWLLGGILAHLAPRSPR